MENNKKVPTYEVKYIETKEQEQQKLIFEQEQELVENSYYLENESWSDIGAPKGYGPIEAPTNRCHNHPINFTRFYASQNGWYMVAGVQANGSWCCGFHQSRGTNHNRGRNNNYVPPSPGDNPTPPSSSNTSTQQYNCSRARCTNLVSVRGGYCHLHPNG